MSEEFGGVAGAETILTFALGFLIASLIALIFAAPLWRRAEKVTKKRLESALPVSVEDIAADKDKLRADFALTTRKLELNLEKLRKKAQAQMTTVQQGNSKLVDLKSELKTKTETEVTHESELKGLIEKLAHSEGELNRRTKQMDDMRSKLSELQVVLDRQANAIKEASSLADGHRDEIGGLKSDVADKSSDIAKQAKAITARDDKLAECGDRVAAQKMLVAAKTAELEVSAARFAALQAELATQGDKLKSAQDKVGELGVREAELKRANGEISGLKGQITTMGDEFKNRVAADHRENAALRQRIGDLATDVDRMSDALDQSNLSLMEVGTHPTETLGKNSGAKEILARSVPLASLGKNLVPVSGDDEPAGGEDIPMAGKTVKLADRIRSLQRGILN